MTTHEIALNNGVITHPGGEGDHYHFLNHLATIKVAASGERSMSVVEFLAPRGFGPPLHTHRNEDEMFIVLEGRIAFFTGSDRFESGEGSMAYLPHSEPHTFQVLTDTARLVTVTASNSAVPQFDAMVAALGTAAGNPTLPDPTPIDPGLVADVCARHGIDIVGPPPTPLPDTPTNQQT